MVFFISLQEDYGTCDYKLVGSSCDGFGFYASLGANRVPRSEKAIINQDIDLNIFSNTIQLERRHLISIPGAPGFSWIVITGQEVRKQFSTWLFLSFRMLCNNYDDCYKYLHVKFLNN